MAKRKAAAHKVTRRPRGEIDRNYFFGDVLIKTGTALYVAIGVTGLLTAWLMQGALSPQTPPIYTLLGVFAVVGLGLFIFGRHLRKEATQWDTD